MFREIARFELKYHLKTPLFVFGILIFFAMAMLMVVESEFGDSKAIHANAPWVVMQILLMFSLFGTLTTAAFVVSSIHRDFELQMDALFFSRPIAKWQYVAGRFAGSFAAGILIYLGVIAAILLAPLTPWLDAAQLGPYSVYPALFSLVVLVIPNLLFIGAVLFAVIVMTRSLMATYAAMAVMALLYGVGMTLAWDIEKAWLAGMIDPFGVVTFFRVTRYWTVVEKNTQVIALDGLFLWNRLFWLSAGGAFLALAYKSFDFTNRGARASRAQLAAVAAGDVEAVTLPRVAPRFSAFSQFLAIVRTEALATFKSVPFVVILLCGIFMVVGESLDGARLGESLPVTRQMMSAIAEAFIVFSLMIAGFYAGEAVWRERALKTNELTDAMPVPTWTQWAAKLTGVVAVSLSTLLAAVLTGIAMQAAKGYYDFELDLYLRGVIGHYGYRLVLVTALAFVFQVVFNHRMAGFIGMAVWFVGTQMLRERGFEHVLYRFAAHPPAQYSDMNGYGHFVAPVVWLLLYWTLFTGLLLALVHLLWNRGTEMNLRHRLRVARRRFTRRVAVTAAALFVAFASTGCFIYYNTNVLNAYRTGWSVDELAAQLEKKYKRYAGLPQPRIVAVKANVDLDPAKRAISIAGSYVATNKSNVPIRELHVNWSPARLTTFEATVPGARVKSDDPELGYRIYTLAEELKPGASITMTFKTAWEARGFVAGQSYNKVVHNGTFINSLDTFPHIGYSPRAELEEDREAHGLPPRPRLAPPSDLEARGENAFARRTDWLSLDTTVSTSADQIAIAPGYLQREWTANGRRYFHYKTEAPIRGYWAYLSARYEVKRDAWNGIPIEVYYDAKHPHNAGRMIAAVKKSLAYYSKHFSPYQHRQARIVEFPGYATFAQAFPNTIAWSENMGFITDLRDPRALDYVTYAAAHEIGHQWWGHQIMGGNVQGVSMLHESLAQYAALMVLEQETDPATMKRYLRYELDRYLAMRGNERVREMPLMLVERQSYIHYQKGAVVFYALRDYLGEERLNRALAKFIRDYAYTGPPYTTAAELVKYIRAEAPPEYQNLITDLFERITLYDLETKEAAAKQRADGRYVVTLTVAAAKLYSDGVGNETAAKIDDWIDIGVFTGPSDDHLGKTLFAEKRRITKPVETFEIVVDEKPARAGIDPFNKLIDRTPRDNTKGM